jgi:hypothetical protein
MFGIIHFLSVCLTLVQATLSIGSSSVSVVDHNPKRLLLVIAFHPLLTSPSGSSDADRYGELPVCPRSTNHGE